MDADTDGQAPRSLFQEDGAVNRSLFDPEALEALEACVGWLRTVERSMMLPIDLIIVLLRRGDPSLRRSIARVARGRDDATGLVEQLEALARRVDRRGEGEAGLHLDQFSLGLIGILDDAMAWAREAGRTRLSEADLVRVVRWRAELQDSASVRWALKQLAQPGDERLFELDGSLRSGAFSTAMWEILQDGMRLASQSGMPFLGTPHVMASLSRMEGGALYRAALRASVTPTRLHDEFMRIVGRREPAQPAFTLGRRTLTPRLVRMIVGASEKLERGGDTIGEAELLEAFLDDGGSSLDLAQTLGIVVPLRSELGEPRIHAVERDEPGAGMGSGFTDEAPLQGSPVLDQLGRDLTAEVRAGSLPDIRGREEELQRVINVLLRPEQRNPLLTGEAGVGKTALAVALARRIVAGTVPERLRNMRVIEINGAGLVGGTSYRGELEARIRAILDEAEKDVILFMDEAHAVFAPRLGAGQPAEVPNHFKSALASGRIAVVAATTEAEYHRWIEQDPALQRRFERIVIPEMSRDLTAEILGGLGPTYGEAYGVTVAPDAVDAAIDLSVRFMPEAALPDKAKKVLMDAVISVASAHAAAHPSAPEDSPPSAGDTSSAGNTPARRPTADREDVAREVARKTGIPLDRVLRSSSPGWWADLRRRLRDHALGRDAVVAEVTTALVQGRLRSADGAGVPCTMAFIGPAGSGKTRLARGLARELHGDERAVISLDMSDYQEAHSLSRLIGAAPGYVGYQDEDALVTPLRRRPAAVVLLQSFQLAHPRVQDRILRLLGDGELADTRGLRADARHATFILTLDVESTRTQSIGFGTSEPPPLRSRLPRADQLLAERLERAGVTLVDFTSAEARSGYAEAWIDEQLENLRQSLRAEFDVPLDVDEEILETLRVRAAEDGATEHLETLFRELVIEPVTRRLLHGDEDASDAASDAAPDSTATPAVRGRPPSATGDPPVVPALPSGRARVTRKL